RAEPDRQRPRLSPARLGAQSAAAHTRPPRLRALAPGVTQANAVAGLECVGNSQVCPREQTPRSVLRKVGAPRSSHRLPPEPVQTIVLPRWANGRALPSRDFR